MGAKLVPFAVMIAVQCLNIGMTTLSKAALSKGMSHFVFVLYSMPWPRSSSFLLPSSFAGLWSLFPPFLLFIFPLLTNYYSSTNVKSIKYSV
uniref:Uncharacterized protein n=1 Tax=Nelumbo nucifera TaxID=4432 RepID=A0A822YU68_NELNU|nr:TPA_asm: hypothetical protein HUJ06_005285 [Nelumbo nucifera]